eukprot:gene36575-45109_t
MSESPLEKPAPFNNQGQDRMDAGFRSPNEAITEQRKEHIEIWLRSARESQRLDMQRLDNEIDQLSRWTIGLVVSVVIGLATVLARTITGL